MVTDTTIASRRHPIIARLRAAARRESADVLLDGAHLLAEALRSGTRLDAVAVTTRAATRADVRPLLDQAAGRGIPVHVIADALADAASPARTPTGVTALALVDMAELDTLLCAPLPLLVVLAGVQDPGNVGSIIRSAEAAGGTGLIVLEGTADPLGWKALRGSMGSALRVPLHRSHDDDALFGALRAHGIQVLAADASGALAAAPDVTLPTAVVLGAEGAGLSAAMLRCADATVTIPLAPPVESLNVAVAASLLLFECRRRRGRGAVWE